VEARFSAIREFPGRSLTTAPTLLRHADQDAAESSAKDQTAPPPEVKTPEQILHQIEAKGRRTTSFLFSTGNTERVSPPLADILARGFRRSSDAVASTSAKAYG
jgi:hypothetical protein